MIHFCLLGERSCSKMLLELPYLEVVFMIVDAQNYAEYIHSWISTYTYIISLSLSHIQTITHVLQCLFALYTCIYTAFIYALTGVSVCLCKCVNKVEKVSKYRKAVWPVFILFHICVFLCTSLYPISPPSSVRPITQAHFYSLVAEVAAPLRGGFTLWLPSWYSEWNSLASRAPKYPWI